MVGQEQTKGTERLHPINQEMKQLKHKVSSIAKGQSWKHKKRGSVVAIVGRAGDKQSWRIQRQSSGIIHKTSARDILVHYQRI